jgi:hypothetical protein
MPTGIFILIKKETLIEMEKDHLDIKPMMQEIKEYIVLEAYHIFAG